MLLKQFSHPYRERLSKEWLLLLRDRQSVLKVHVLLAVRCERVLHTYCRALGFFLMRHSEVTWGRILLRRELVGNAQVCVDELVHDGR